MLETMKRGDKDAAAAQMKAHIGSIRRKFMED
jgi:DNA-binding GntR family transcriptional regulator